MQSVRTDDSLKRAFLPRDRYGYTVPSDNSRDSEDDTDRPTNHLLYLGKTDLPQHPVRVRLLPYSKQRLLLYGKDGYQEMTACQAPEFYCLQSFCRQVMISDCVETNDQHVYTISRSHCCGVIVHYDSFMSRLNVTEVPYPLGCLSSMAVNCSSTYFYATNPELNCVLRFTCDDLALKKCVRFGTLWRPFDCCISQEFKMPDGASVEYLFVSNLDAGICAFNLETMEAVAECGDDLLPGAKYLAYDAKRNLLFVSCSCERLLRCYKFIWHRSAAASHSALDTSICSFDEDAISLVAKNGGDSDPPSLQKIGDFLVANRKPSVRSGGPQCIMWDPEMDQLAIVSWSHVKGKFSNKVFRVNI